MAIIDKSYFVGSLQIVGVDMIIGNGEKPTNDILTRYINFYEPELLCDLFGVDMYNELLTQLQLPAANPCYQNLICGTTFINRCGKKIKWPGLKNCNAATCSVQPESLISYYIYYKYFNERLVTQSTMMGEVKAENDNSTVTDNNRKAIRSYNKFIELKTILYQFIEANESCFPLFQKTCKYSKRQNSFGL